MRLNRFFLGVAIVLAICTLTTTVWAGEVEVLHWWTSGGEAAAVQQLQKMLKTEGHTWKDFAVAGGAGANAMTALKSRAVSGNPPHRRPGQRPPDPGMGRSRRTDESGRRRPGRELG